ncbi:SPFH domain-containing protein [Alteromonas sp. ASW11-130]|uniref:SPFH domain-containing protein n=1 Tax=Alteromonas sp. ASW11-130 TaxID=3015775 RepID=UPI002241CB92|nr:SPFH domain-containing protein [Alteromonas sp. ASW11-130]MCW8091735.1 SPFH domain-containing protein [Alteromonas sp. ASW11-130]
MNEKQGFSLNGYIAGLLVLLPLQLLSVYWMNEAPSIPKLLFIVIVAVCWSGFFMVQPNQGKVFTMFGSYMGTERRDGLRWTIPFFMRQTVSLRIRNFESAKMKVNDNQGNPIEIASIIVWSVTDTAEAVFEVDDYESYVTIQSESAIRNMASDFPYDPRDDAMAEIALRSHPAEISYRLQQEIQDRLNKAGITVHEARISHLAYSAEIASAMLQRQQATAIIAARSRIVDGAVGMVEMALARLSENNIVELDEERKANMVSNLLVVLCGDKATQPVVNTGSLY